MATFKSFRGGTTQLSAIGALPKLTRRSFGGRRSGKILESDVQEAYFKFLRLWKLPSGLTLADYGFSVPNGIYIPGDPRRSAMIMASLKRTGLKPGVSDVMMAFPVFPFHGMFLEIKRGNEKPTDEQQIWLDRMHDRGYYAVCAHGLDDAIRHTKVYCDGGLRLEGRNGV